MNSKKINIPSEIAYIIAIFMLSFAVAMITITDFGVSMVVAPAFILSERLSFLTFGQSEYVIQSILFIIFCFIMKKVKAVYFSSFLNCIVYGAVLDLWRLIPIFNQSVTSAEDLALTTRVVFFVVGMLLTSLSIALFFKTYLYPQVYDFFVKGVSEKFGFNRTITKTCFDASFLLIAVLMSLLFFQKFVGINFGTLIMTVFNGTIIGFFSKLLDKYFTFSPIAKSFSKHFDLSE